jgi:hypothetical protein
MSLIPHCRRVNLRAGQIKAAHQNFPEIPDPKRHGWIPSDSNEPILEPVWSEGPILPDKLIDLVTKDGHEDSDSDQEEGNGFDSEDTDTDCSSDDYDSD